jgi:hypothetical protein
MSSRSRLEARFTWSLLVVFLALGTLWGCEKKAQERTGQPLPETAAPDVEPTNTSTDTLSTPAKEGRVPNANPSNGQGPSHDSTAVPDAEPPVIVKHVSPNSQGHVVHHK